MSEPSIPLPHWSRLDQLSPVSLLRIMRARQEVFIVEQQIVCQDADKLDEQAWHLTMWTDGAGSSVAGYLRLFEPDVKYRGYAAFGRVLTTKQWRATGLGKALVAEAVRFCDDRFPGVPLKISAQAYLTRFYGAFGFEVRGAE